MIFALFVRCIIETLSLIVIATKTQSIAEAEAPAAEEAFEAVSVGIVSKDPPPPPRPAKDQDEEKKKKQQTVLFYYDAD